MSSKIRHLSRARHRLDKISAKIGHFSSTAITVSTWSAKSESDERSLDGYDIAFM